MTQAEKQAKITAIAEKLKEIYPDAICALHWDGDPWRLMIMGRLSAQCTDARVNLVCQDLFRRFPTPEALAAGALPDIEDCIRSCGLYRVKAQNIRDASAMLVRDFGGRMPDNMDDLLKLPGVGRKVANLILGDLYGTGGTVADTHCIRICGRFGMYPESLKDPVQVNASWMPSSPNRNAPTSATASSSSAETPAPPARQNAHPAQCETSAEDLGAPPQTPLRTFFRMKGKLIALAMSLLRTPRTSPQRAPVEVVRKRYVLRFGCPLR